MPVMASLAPHTVTGIGTGWYWLLLITTSAPPPPLQVTYSWIKGQIAKEVSERGVDPTKYSQSTIVKTSAPTELGSLRQADGEEGFDKQ
jgi:hypothetical protein